MYYLWKNIFLTFVFLFSLFSLEKTFASGEETTHFVITAYYSPLPDQIDYITGSYEGDIKLNGHGVHTASGKDVFPGVLAGPSNYPFGTKIYFEGYGIGVIEDRGWAIVKAGERGHSYDRLDIWMGYGDEGLSRAKTWGKRTIKAKIVVPSSPVNLQFGEAGISGISDLQVEPESQSGSILKLQALFQELKLYDGELDGVYASIADELLNFQIQNGIVKDAQDWGAGYFGNKTIAVLQKKYGKTIPLISEPVENFSEFNHISTSKKYKYILDYGDLEVDPESESGSIMQLQELLWKLGEYNGEIDGEFESVKEDFVNLQVKLGVISSASHEHAGYFGPKTKTALWNYYSTHEDTPHIEETPTKVDEKVILGSGLTAQEKQKLDAIVEKLEQELSKRAEKKGISASENITRFKTELGWYLPQVQKESIKQKLQYIVESL